VGRSKTPKEHNSLVVADRKDREIYELLDKEFKIIVLWKLSEVQENTEK
jgi:hypothetical protein